MKWPFSHTEHSEKEHIVVVLLGQKDVTAWLCLIDSTHKHIEFVDERQFTTSSTWDSLVYELDEVLFAFENAHSIEVKKASFFVYTHVIDRETGDLQESYLNMLKTVLKENRLTSLGYVEIEESLVAILQEQEKSPLNAVLIEVDMSSVSLSVYKGGKRVYAQLMAKSARCVSDVESLIASMPQNIMLPARIILYDTPSVENESHEILTHAWNSKNFIQIPQVSVVKPTDVKSAVVHGLSLELFETSGSTSRTVEVSQEEAVGLSVQDDEMREGDVVGASAVVVTPVSATTAASAASAAAPSIAGFVIGGDVRSDSSDVLSNQSQTTIVAQSVQPAYAEEAYTEEVDRNNEFEHEPAQSVAQSPEGNGRLSAILDTIQRVARSTRTKLMSSRMSFKRFGIITLLLLVVSGGVAGVMYYGHSAKVTVLYASEVIDANVTLSKGVKLAEITKTVKAQAKVSTTGTDDVGDRAKGTLTIFNADEKSKSFDKGTKVRTTEGNVYTLDKAVTVEGAKKTVTNDENILTSTAKAQVTATADDIGSKYNIKKDVKLTIDGFSSTTYFAKTESAFEGGSSKQIQTVDADDYAALDARIEKDIQTQAAEIAKSSKAAGGVVKDLTVIDTSNQTYSHEINEEADEVSSTVQAKVTLYTVDDAEIKKALLEEVRSEVPDGYILSARSITFRVVKATRDDTSDAVELQCAVKAQPQKSIDVVKVSKEIRGKSFDVAEAHVKDMFQVEGLDVTVDSPLPFLRSRIPFFTKHVSIQLKPL